MGVLQRIARELDMLRGLRSLDKWVGSIDPESDRLLPDDIEAVVDRYPDNVAWRFEGTLTTYAEMDALANRVAHWALARGLRAGDAVALFMENRPEYFAIWYGLSKVGVVAGLINHNLTDEALAHCVDIAAARLVITGADQDAAIRGVSGHLAGDPDIWSYGGSEGADLLRALAAESPRRPGGAHRGGLRGRDQCLYVYTSGTTGMPKAARLSHARTRGMMRSFIAPCGITPRDRIYITLPLYHGTGGLCGVGQALMTGASVVLRRKFSASRFWDDAVDEDVTAIVYIGELCRYLVNAPPHPRERAHRIRTGFGNGLRPDIWQTFLDRFAIPQLCEFYGSTEGNVSFINIDGKVGAVGRIPGYLEKSVFGHIAFVKFDVVEEQPLRDTDGFCIPTGPGEAGEAIGRVGQALRTRFDGYNDESASKNKVLRDVFAKGDMWFRTGDLMKKDADGYVYFVDRIGDTFRWKGENVSTGEVAECVARAPGITTANVYGVEVPGSDGRAGMAAITADGTEDVDSLHAWLGEHLPRYAIPLFIRLQKEAVTTGTFKYRKVELVAEGFDPRRVEDPLWYYDATIDRYRRMTDDDYERVLRGEVRF